MVSDLEYLVLSRKLVCDQKEDLEARIHRATKGKNIEYRFMLEFFKTELKLWLDAVEIKDFILNLEDDGIKPL